MTAPMRSRGCRCESCWWPMRLIARLPDPLFAKLRVILIRASLNNARPTAPTDPQETPMPDRGPKMDSRPAELHAIARRIEPAFPEAAGELRGIAATLADQPLCEPHGHPTRDCRACVYTARYAREGDPMTERLVGQTESAERQLTATEKATRFDGRSVSPSEAVPCTCKNYFCEVHGWL